MAFDYENKYIMLDINTIERLDKIATPFYYYDMELFHKTVDHVAELALQHDIKIHYAIKANVDQLRSRVNTPGISLEEAAALMQEMNELQKLINSSS